MEKKEELPTWALTLAPRIDLNEQIAKYNGCRNPAYHLVADKAGQYSGLLEFQCIRGDSVTVQQVTATNASTSAELIPVLSRMLYPTLELRSGDIEQMRLTLKQGEMERELETNEKPLEIALNCSSQGLASPTFCAKVLAMQKQSSISDVSMKLENFHTQVELNYGRNSPSQHDGSSRSQNSSAKSSPIASTKHAHTKWAVPDIITRSLRVKKKSRKPIVLNHPIERQINTLLSPLPPEKQFPMSVVMHIYYGINKKMSLYKSVLVSEKSSTQEVIAQALERYNLQFCSPDHYTLNEVIGKWQEVEAHNEQHNDQEHIKSSLKVKDKNQVTEEFIVCFERELHPMEHPYNSQFYLEPSKGFDRRFELRKNDKTDRRYNSSATKKVKAAAYNGEKISDVSSDIIPAQCHQDLLPSFCGMYSANLTSAFVLFVRLHDQTKEFLVHQLIAEQTQFRHVIQETKVSGACTSTTSTVELLSPEFAIQTQPVCTIKKKLSKASWDSKEKFHYFIEVAQRDIDVFLNGCLVEHSVQLQLGDLVSLGHSYTFVFYDSSDKLKEQSQYTWEKKLFKSLEVEKGAVAQYHGSVSDSSCISSKFDIVMVAPTSQKGNNSIPHCNPVFFTAEGFTTLDCGSELSHESSPAEDQFEKHTWLFNDNANEDFTLTNVIEKFEPASNNFKLLPVYFLAMYVKCQLRSHGIAAAMSCIAKVSQRLQQVLWKTCTCWCSERPYELYNNELQKASNMDEVLGHLKPVFSWLSNIMEFYFFLLNDKELAISNFDVDENSPLSILHQALVFAFQQAFYEISKVLYNILPVMLVEPPPDSVSGHNILIGQAVDFLQSLLNLLNDLQVNIEVTLQLFSNLFYFINAAMFNYLVINGAKFKVFQHNRGKYLRLNLDLLEGWACQVGFKNLVLNYMAKLGSAVDLLCTPTEDLLEMNWRVLRQEFPVLHPAQLHFILTLYAANCMGSHPAAWLPSDTDTADAQNTDAVNERFDTGPEFCIPCQGYSLDLNESLPQVHDYLKTLEAALNCKKSTEVLAEIEDRPSVKMPDLITNFDDTKQKVDEEPDKPSVQLAGQLGKDYHLYEEWASAHFPKGSRIVTVPRGDKGFGVIMVEGKDYATDNAAIFIQSILPGSTASETKELSPGDRILAIDTQILEGADYPIAQRYLNEAEEEVVLIIAAKH